MYILANIDTVLKVAFVSSDSVVDGKGLRTVLWLQGCSIQCNGCHNKHLWNTDEGIYMTVRNLFNKLPIDHDKMDGITISGGEPLDQWEVVNVLVGEYKKRYPENNIWLYTGREYNEIVELNPSPFDVGIDVLVIGRFNEKKIYSGSGWAGSNNQKIFEKNDSGEYSVKKYD